MVYFYRLHKTLNTSDKPSAIVELNSAMLAVSVGSLAEISYIELWSYMDGLKIGQIKAHENMIDSMVRINLNPVPAESELIKGK